MQVGLLLIDGFALMSYASVIEPFRAANNLSGQELYRWKHLSVAGAQVSASNGLTSLVDYPVSDAPALDRVFVFAAGDPAAYADERCFRWLRQQARQGVHIGGVSGGPFLLARAGLLHGYRMTIHWEHVAAFQDEFSDYVVDSGLFVIDRDRMTCAGGTAGLDLALTLIEQDHGALLARQVAEWFIQTEQRQSNVSQRLSLAHRYGTQNRHLLNMLAAMEAAIEIPLTRRGLADAIGVSLSQLERLCQAHLRSSIADIYFHIRLDHAAHLLRSTTHSITAVSLQCGFATASHFSRAFKARFGMPPSRWTGRQ